MDNTKNENTLAKQTSTLVETRLAQIEQEAYLSAPPLVASKLMPNVANTMPLELAATPIHIGAYDLTPGTNLTFRPEALIADHPFMDYLNQFEYKRFDVLFHFQIVSHLQLAFALFLFGYRPADEFHLSTSSPAQIMDLENCTLVTDQDSSEVKILSNWTLPHTLSTGTEHEHIGMYLSSLIVPTNAPPNITVIGRLSIVNPQWDAIYL